MYYLLFGFTYLISLLPLKILYLFSDGLYLMIYKWLGYRKEIVRGNLTRSFPEKTTREIEIIEKEFYHSFCDQWVETLKLLSMPVKRLKQHIQTEGTGIQEAMKNPSQKIIILLGHQFNWEMANLIGPFATVWQYAGLYLPLSSKPFDRLILYLRKRTGSLMISSKEIGAGLKQLHSNQTILGFIADQTPPGEKTSCWVNFLNQPTPFLNGPAKMARHQKAAIVWLNIKKTGRGQYLFQHYLGYSNAAGYSDETIIKGYARFLEEQLKNQPANWMWTHRRWKRKPPEEVLERLRRG